MNYVTSTPIGIDTAINSIQSELYDLLIARWTDDLDSYGRVHRNVNSEGKVVPEFVIDSKNYQNAFYDDSKSGLFFFIDNPTQRTEDEYVFTNEVKVVFMVDLTRIFTNPPLRPDEEARRDALEMLRKISDQRYTITRIEKGISNVFTGFETEQIKFNDISPYHVFAVVIDLNYYLTDKCV